MTKQEIIKTIEDFDHDEWYILDKNDADYEFFVNTVKHLIDTRWDLLNQWQLDFNNDYSKIRKQLSHLRGAAFIWTENDFNLMLKAEQIV